MKIKILLCLFLVFFIQISYAQYKEGYIITNNNDTISGFINYEGPAQNAFNCDFRKSENAATESYAPGEIKAFRFIDSKYFASDEIMIKETLTPVFLEWLIMGEANVLSFTPANLKIRYFLKLDDGSLEELKNSAISKNASSGTYEINRKEYIGQLKYQFNDEPSLYNQIENSSLTAKSLIKISKKYHDLKCPDEECLIFEDKNRKTSLYIGPTLSFIASKCDLNKDIEGDFSLVTGLGYGVTLKIGNSPILPPKISFLLGVTFYDLLYEYDGDFFYYVDDYRVASVKYIRIPASISYKVFNKPSSPYINAGATVNFRYDYKFYDEMLVRRLYGQSLDPVSMSKIQAGFNVGLGYEININSKFGADVLCSYERIFRFWGESVSDKSFLNNFMGNLTFYYRIR